MQGAGHPARGDPDAGALRGGHRASARRLEGIQELGHGRNGLLRPHAGQHRAGHAGDEGACECLGQRRPADLAPAAGQRPPQHLRVQRRQRRLRPPARFRRHSAEAGGHLARRRAQRAGAQRAEPCPAADRSAAVADRVSAAGSPRRVTGWSRRRTGMPSWTPSRQTPAASWRRSPPARRNDPDQGALARSSAAISLPDRFSASAPISSSQLRHAGGAGDRCGDAGPCHQPGQCHLRRAGLVRPSHRRPARPAPQAARVEVLLHRCRRARCSWPGRPRCGTCR